MLPKDDKQEIIKVKITIFNHDCGIYLSVIPRIAILNNFVQNEV